MKFPTFDEWVIENHPGIFSFSRTDIAEMALQYEREKLFSEEGLIPEGVHEDHE